MMRTIFLAATLVFALFGRDAFAQDTWVQIEAQPTLADAEARARAYGGAFPNVAGFAMSSGWYAVVLGPYPPQEAEKTLTLLIGERMIPYDSYLSDGSSYARQFWPVGGAAVIDPASAPLTTPLPDIAALPDESPREARASEAQLNAQERMDLQTALAWFGHYTSAIDGAIGQGTRNSMSAWQASVGFDPTGILTTQQRAALMQSYTDELSALGLQMVRDDRAGIDIQLPMAMVDFDRYETPFAHYKEKDGSGVRVLLISQTGDEATLFGLYDIMQTLAIVPLEGARERSAKAFTLAGQNATLQSYTRAELKDGMIKGFTLVWHPKDGAKMEKVLAVMQSSFAPFGDNALDDVVEEPSAEDMAGLMSGLEVRTPVISRTGFFVDAKGSVLTTVAALDSCGRITIDGGVETDVTVLDADLGFALLTPRTPLAPAGFAKFRDGALRVNAEVAVAGYSYEAALSAPVMTFGTFAEARGLAGEDTLARLVLNTLPGDAGGPVFDASGSVIGMLLPKVTVTGRVLPQDVGFALDAGAIATALSAKEIALDLTPLEGAMAPEDLTAHAVKMTVLVSCWE